MNEATESVATWIKIGQVMQSHARLSLDWSKMIERLNNNRFYKTPDGIEFTDERIDADEINDLIRR